MNTLVLVISALLAILRASDGARILAVVPMPAFSHQSAFRPIWIQLAQRGHEVVLLTTDPVNDPSLKTLHEINLHELYNVLVKHDLQEFFKNVKNDPRVFKKKMHVVVEDLSEEVFKHPDVQSLIHNQTERFDLVMAEVFFPAMYGFSKRFNCPLVGVVSMDAPFYVHDYMGNPTHPVVFPEFVLPFYGKLRFSERVVSVAYNLYCKYFKIYIDDVRDQKLLSKHFSNVTATMQELHEGMSMLFTNSNPIFEGNRPLGPNTITFGGGTHINKRKPLPKDIKEFLDNANKGVVYVSLGSNIRSAELDPEMRKILLTALQELPFKVLWKFETDELLNENYKKIKTVDWLPQQDVLAHPNIKVFITQGGLQSMDESIFARVPMVGLPFFGDQSSNAIRMAAKGMGLYLNPSTMTKEALKAAVFEVASNSKYRNAVKDLAELSEDQPISGLDKVVWYTEYVIRRKGAAHLKYPGNDIPFYQYFFLDIAVLILTLIALFVIISYIFVKIAYNLTIGIFSFVSKTKTE